MITLLYWQKLEPSELNAARIVEFAGLEVNLLNLGETHGVNPGVLQSLIPAAGIVIARAGALIEISRNSPPDGDVVRELTSRAARCLVYGFEATAEHCRLLRQLTSGGLLGVEALLPGDAEFSVERGARGICRHFAGLTVGKAEPHHDLTFTEGVNLVGCTPLIRIRSRPFLVSVASQSCELLLLACREIADLDETVPHDASTVNWFSRLAPLLMFLRWAGGEHCWHSDTPQACLIIDDPPLRKRYGFLDYEKLLELMESEQFSTSIAFIPWNYRRSSRRTTELFLRFPHRYTVCVHGCDHTGGEFGSMDLPSLKRLAQEGLHRMVSHQKLTGIGFDEVMVFPQGSFSTIAMKALKVCGYLAAVNSTPRPVDDIGHSLRLRDLADCAVTSFSGFPLFTRRYPKDLAGLAFDLLLGKPALLVEHHGYFRSGYAQLTGTIQKLKEMEGRLEWSKLSTICSRACLMRRAGNGDIHVKFYTDRFCWRNESEQAQRYVLFRRQVAGELAPDVTINGVAVQCECEADDLKMAVVLNPGQTAEIQIRHSGPDSLGIVPAPRPGRRVSVFVRRHLCEFRDNYVDKISILSRVASGLRNYLVRNT